MGSKAILGLLILVAGCYRPAAPRSASHVELDVPPTSSYEVPATATEFVYMVAGPPRSPLRLTYRVQGPHRMQGRMEVIAAPQARRHQSWSLSFPLPDGTTQTIEGVAVQTPDVEWSRTGTETPIARPTPLGPMSRAYASLPAELRALVAYHAHRWRDELERGRSEHPGPTRAYLGIPCLHSKVADHDLCVWEAPSLVLHYQSDIFDIEVERIEEDANVSDALFEVPKSARFVNDAPTPDDGMSQVVAIAGGDYAELARALRPTPRLPL